MDGNETYREIVLSQLTAGGGMSGPDQGRAPGEPPARRGPARRRAPTRPGAGWRTLVEKALDFKGSSPAAADAAPQRVAIARALLFESQRRADRHRAEGPRPATT
jgi:hypothetical protein